MARSDAPIIIKKIKKSGHAHHGGAWKVAYADFVTAMMAFFLLLWLLNVTTDIERKGIADYFAPASISQSQSGAGGVFGGQTITAPGAQINDSSPVGTSKAIPEPDESEQGRKEDPGSGQPTGPKESTTGEVQSGPNAQVPAAISKLEKVEPEEAKPAEDEKKSEEEKAAEAKKKEEEAFKKAETALRDAIRESGMADLEKNLIIDSTPEGLRIQIVDRDGYSLFATGNAQFTEKSRRLVTLVGMVLARLPNNITVTGHTDNSPFPPGARRTNWDLSSARAITSLQTIMQAGVPQERVMGVTGKADRDPLVKDNPKDPQNRRISIVLLRRFAGETKTETDTQPPSVPPQAPDTKPVFTVPEPAATTPPPSPPEADALKEQENAVPSAATPAP